MIDTPSTTVILGHFWLGHDTTACLHKAAQIEAVYKVDDGGGHNIEGDTTWYRA